MQNNKGFSNILVISIVLVLLGVGGYFGYMYIKKSSAPILNEPTESQPQPITKKSLPTDQELIDSIRKDMELNKDEEIIIDGYEKSDKYEIVFTRYQRAGNLLSKQSGSDKWVYEMSQQQGPAMYECNILDKLGFSKIECFNYDKQQKRIDGIYQASERTRPQNEDLIDQIRTDMKLKSKEKITINDYLTSDNYEVVFASYQLAEHVLSRAWGTGEWIHEQGTQKAYSCKVLDKLGLPKYKCFNYDTQKYRVDGVYKDN